MIIGTTDLRRRVKKGFNSEFLGGNPNRYKPKEGPTPKRCDDKYEDNIV